MMIDVIKRTPAEYSKQSRDYQVLARLYTALFNVSKMYIDNLSVWDSDIDNKLSLLRAKTLNFNPRHDWDLDNLEAITSCFKYLMRNKGTKQALIYCISILMKIEKLSSKVTDASISIENNHITIRLEEGLVTLGVLEDLLQYLLPAGLTYRVLVSKTMNLDDLMQTDIYYLKDTTDSVTYEERPDTLNVMTIGQTGAEYSTEDDNKVINKYDTYVYADEKFIKEEKVND